MVSLLDDAIPVASTLLQQSRALSRDEKRRSFSVMLKTIEKVPDRILTVKLFQFKFDAKIQLIFGHLLPAEILQASRVCKKWKTIASSPELWHFVSFRPNGGVQVTNHDFFVSLIGTRFVELQSCELATDLITPNVIHELANKCPKLQDLTLDFSMAMQLHDFNDLQTFPSRLKKLTLCLSENIFLEGFLRKVYTFISPVEVLHIIGEAFAFCN